MKCKICEERTPRRFCPGVGGDICSVCCGEQREVTINCPFECEYLREARLHEKIPAPDASEIPNQDIRVTERFLSEHEDLFILASLALLRAGLETHGAVDSDVREALDSLIRTHRTLQSGLYYESKPDNLIAAGIQSRFQKQIAELRKR